MQRALDKLAVTAGPCPHRRQPREGLRAAGADHRQGRQPVRLHCRSVHSCQGHARPADGAATTRSIRSTASPSTRATARSGTMLRCASIGPCPIHRRTLSQKVLWRQLTLSSARGARRWRRRICASGAIALSRTNYRSRYGEIDIIARKRGSISSLPRSSCAGSAHFGAAREFVDARKQERLRATASMFLEEHETALQPRFDVIEIYAPDGHADQASLPPAD